MYVDRTEVESYVSPAVPTLPPVKSPVTGSGTAPLPKDTVDFGHGGSVVDPPASGGSSDVAPVGGGLVGPVHGPTAPGGSVPVGGPAGGSIDPVVLPKPVDGTTPATGTTTSETQHTLLIPIGSAKAVRRRLNKELNALRIAVRRELKLQFGDRLKNDPALKAKSRELVRAFQNQLRTAFEHAGGKGKTEIDGDSLLSGLKQAFNDLSAGLSASVGVNLASTTTSGEVAASPSRTTNSAANASLTSPGVNGASPLPNIVSDARLEKMTALFDQRYQRIESYLTDQALLTSTAQATPATRRATIAPAVSPVGTSLNIAV